MNHLIDFFKRTPLSEFIYPAILAVCALFIIVAFILSTGFLTREINRVFVIEAVGTDFSIDLAHYRLVAHKLGLPEDIVAVAAPSVPAIVENISTSTESTVATPTPPLDKTAITIAVYNATGVPGLAGRTKDTLVAAGFAVAKTGNSKAQSTNTIALKESATEYLPLLREALGASFAEATVIPALADALYDCAITIGVK